MYKLLIEDDEGGKTAVSLLRDEITIGRKEGNTIRLTERNVSRRHGRIIRDDVRIYIEDVSARYGIKKNGKKIDDRAEMKEGDVVLIGDYRLTLQAEKKKKKPAARAPGKADRSGATKITSLEELSGGNDFGEDRRENTQIMKTMPAKLVVISSNFAGEEFPLHSDEMIIGRGDECHIIIDHLSISNTHAKIVRKDRTTYNIVDLNSSNGVKVSGETYPATHLKRGDVIELGQVKFRFVEPGENYVFTPQAPELMPAASPGGGIDRKLAIGLLLGILLAVVVVVGFMMSGPDTGTDGGDVPSASEAEMAEIARDLEEMEVDEGEDPISARINIARQEIEEGKLQRAAGRLDLLKDFEPSAEQRREIDELLSRARNEVPFQRSYEQALEHLDDGDHLAALQEVASVPSHSFFYQRMEDEGVFREIFGGVLEDARDALEEGEADVATDMAEEVLMARSDHAEAIELLEEIERVERQRQQAVSQAREDRQQANRDTTTARTPTPTPTPAAEQGSLSNEEARELFMGAARKMTNNDSQGAIEDCTRALQAGYSDCHRIIGLAYVRMNDSASACRHFRQYMATGPSNPGPVERQMDSQGCE